MPQRRYLRPERAVMPWPRSRHAARRWGRGRLRPRLLRGTLLLMVIVFLAASAGVAWVSKDLPRPGVLTDRAVKESTKIYDRSGSTLLYEIGEVKRTRVPLSDIAPSMRSATIATEDREFYTHRGFALRGILRAVARARPGQRLQGGSTITQQLVKNALLTPERTLTRKVKEFLLAITIEQRYTKDEVLELYLNEIPYGANAYGVEAAARQYFGTTAKDLSLAQAALLAALPKAPSYYSPYGSHKEELFARQHWILDSMVELGVVSREDGETAKRVTLSFPAQRTDSILAPHFVFYVRELLEQEYGETLVEQGGLTVTTSLDMNLERAAEDAITSRAATNRQLGARNAALVAIDPKRGDILSMVGSVDYFDEENDGNVNVAIRLRSPGSSFKPIVYAEAFRKGYTPNAVLADVPIDFAAAGKSYSPQNYDGKFRGPVTMRQALALSLNVPSVQALYLAGVHDAVALAQRFGYTTLTDPDRYGLSLVLGGGEVRLLDAVSGFGVFATEGTRVPPRAVLKVEAPDGRMLFDAEKEELRPTPVIDPEIARLVTDILADNGARAPVFGAASPLQLGERPVAAKTGTTQDFRDGWTLGYTPSLVAGVWVGNNDNTPMKRGPGADTAAPMWNAFMRAALTGTPIERFTPPAPTETGKGALDGRLPELDVRYEADTGTVIAAACGIDLGVPRRFQEFRSILHYVRRDDPRGVPPSDPEHDPQYAPWEAGIAAWRDQDNAERPTDATHYVDRLPNPSCDAATALQERPSIRFVSPSGDTVKRSPTKIAVEVRAPDPITNVAFFANTTKLGERTEPPWEALYRFGADTHGEVTLRVLAATAAGKQSEARKAILVNPDHTLPRVEILAPRRGETITPANFPYTVKVKASDPAGISEVDVLYSIAGEGRQLRVGRTSTPIANRADRFDISWASPPAPGTYHLRARAKDATGNLAQTSPLLMIVP